MKILLVVETTQREVKKGDMFETSNGLTVKILSCEAPLRPSSSGRIYMKDLDGHFHSFSPSVCGLEFIERRSVEPIPPVSV